MYEYPRLLRNYIQSAEIKSNFAAGNDLSTCRSSSLLVT